MLKRKQHDHAAEAILACLGVLDNYPDEALAPYEEFEAGDKIYYITPGGFLYRKGSGTEKVGAFFCGYLSGEVWPYQSDDG